MPRSKMDHTHKNSRSACQKKFDISLFFIYNFGMLLLLVYTQIKLHLNEEKFKEYALSNTARVEILENRLHKCESNGLQSQRRATVLEHHQTSNSTSGDHNKKLSSLADPHSEDENSNINTNTEKREVISKEQIDFASLLQLKQGPAGPPGARGPAGTPGIQGPPGRDGRDSLNMVAVTHLINSTVNNMVSVEMNKVKQQAKSIPTVSGVTYIRWGRTTCPHPSSYIYQGRAAGQYFNENGGSSQYLCMPDDPEYLDDADESTVTKIYGVEYYKSGHLKGVFGDSNNVPCVLCQTEGRTTKVVFPAKLHCPDSSWTKEYSGYLMTEGVGMTHDARTEYLCVDINAETVPGMVKSEYGSLLYFVGVNCKTGSRSGNLGHCPPYRQSAPITCTVCSK